MLRAWHAYCGAAQELNAKVFLPCLISLSPNSTLYAQLHMTATVVTVLLYCMQLFVGQAA